MKNTTPNANIKLSVQDIEIQHGITDLNEDLKDILGMYIIFLLILLLFQIMSQKIQIVNL